MRMSSLTTIGLYKRGGEKKFVNRSAAIGFTKKKNWFGQVE